MGIIRALGGGAAVVRRGILVVRAVGGGASGQNSREQRKQEPHLDLSYSRERVSMAATNDHPDRFVLELEFVQMLANPQYLQYLSDQQVLDEPAFVNYLRYLKYWQTPPYSQYIAFPYALHLLDLLQSDTFRQACAAKDTCAYLHQKQFMHWQDYRLPKNQLQNK